MPQRFFAKERAGFFKAVWLMGHDPQYRSLVLTTLSLLAGGTVFFHFVEKWKWLDSLYFCVVSLATVGYGDFTPKTALGKIAAIFYLLSGIGILVSFISAVAHHMTQEIEKEKKP